MIKIYADSLNVFVWLKQHISVVILPVHKFMGAI